MGTVNRRNDFRIYLQMFMNEHLADRSHRCMSVNLGPNGLLLNRLILPFQRTSPIVGLEFELPGTSEVVWARGEVRYDSFDQYFHGTGIQFTGMAEKHHRLIQDYVEEQRLRQLSKLLAKIRRNRRHRLH